MLFSNIVWSKLLVGASTLFGGQVLSPKRKQSKEIVKQSEIPMQKAKKNVVAASPTEFDLNTINPIPNKPSPPVIRPEAENRIGISNWISLGLIIVKLTSIE